MATKLYLNTSQAISHPSALSSTLSAVFPAGTDQTSTDSPAAGVYDMTATPTGSQTSKTSSTGASTVLTSARVNTWVSKPLAAQTIASATWTLAVATSCTNNASANQFLAGSIYVVTSAGTVRGYVYDSTAQLDTAYPLLERGRVATVSGNSVTTQAGDQLVFEWWNTGTPSNTADHTITSNWGGTTDPTENVATSSAASYISCPNTIDLAPLTCDASLAATASFSDVMALSASVVANTGTTATPTAAVTWAALFAVTNPGVTATLTGAGLRATFAGASLSVINTATAVEAASDLIAETLAVTATPTATSLRAVFANASLSSIATPTADSLRAVFADASLAETATPAGVMAWAALFSVTDPGATATLSANAVQTLSADSSLAVTAAPLTAVLAASDLMADILAVTATMAAASSMMWSARTSLAETATISTGANLARIFEADLVVTAGLTADTTLVSFAPIPIDANLNITFDQDNTFPYTFPLIFGARAQASIGLGQFMDAIVTSVIADTDVDAERDATENSTLTSTATALAAMSAALEANAELASTATLTGTVAAAYGIAAGLSVTATPTVDAQIRTDWRIDAELIVTTDPPFPYTFPFIFQQSIDSIGLLQSVSAMLSVTAHTPAMVGFGRTANTSLAATATPTAGMVCHYQAGTDLTVTADPEANVSRGQVLDVSLEVEADPSATASHGISIDTPLTVDASTPGIVNIECLVDALLVENLTMPALLGNKILIDTALDAVVETAEAITRGALADASLLIDGNLLTFLRPESNFFPFHLA